MNNRELHGATGTAPVDNRAFVQYAVLTRNPGGTVQMMHRKMQWVLTLGAMVLPLLCGGVARAQKVALVNMQHAIEATNEGKAALAKLKAEVDKKQKELEQKRDELKKLDEDLSKQASILKPDVLDKKKQELQQKMVQWQEAAMRSQKELQEKEAKATQPIVDKILRAVGQIAARDKFTMVLRNEVVLWPQQSEMDITNEVIRKANENK
jgi:outer membrane protein